MCSACGGLPVCAAEGRDGELVAVPWTLSARLTVRSLQTRACSCWLPLQDFNRHALPTIAPPQLAPSPKLLDEWPRHPLLADLRQALARVQALPTHASALATGWHAGARGSRKAGALRRSLHTARLHAPQTGIYETGLNPLHVNTPHTTRWPKAIMRTVAQPQPELK